MKTKQKIQRGGITLLRSLTMMAGAVLLVGLTGCFHSSSSSSSPAPEAPILPEVLDSAASFLAAASGKETPLTVDTVVFINSVMGLNDVATDPRNLYADLWVLLRDEYGAPILDDNGCTQPISDPAGVWPDGVEPSDTVPMVFNVDEDRCEIEMGYEYLTMELDIGRLNMVRNMTNNPDALARALTEVINGINESQGVSTDPAGRLVLTVLQDGVPVDKTIDSPRENLAMYYALMKEGRLAGYGISDEHGGGHGGGGHARPAVDTAVTLLSVDVAAALPWLEIRADLDLGDLAYLRDGTPDRSSGVSLYNGYADLSVMHHDRQMDYEDTLIPYIQYIEGATCGYWDMLGYAWTRVFNEEPYVGDNIAGFATHADDARRTIVFVHEIIQDLPETELATLPPQVDELDQVMQVDTLNLAATFLGGASNKTVPLSIDGLVFINSVMGLNNVSATPQDLYGDLWKLVRDENGVPVLLDGCPQPIASEPVVWPDTVERDTLPMVLEEDKCEIVVGYEDYVVELELGRLNGVRVLANNPDALDRTLYDLVQSINAAGELGLKRDLAGRLAYGTVDGYQTVDSPRAGMALYKALMEFGKLDGITLQIRGEEGVMVDYVIDITVPQGVLDAQGLGYLKQGDQACQDNSANCGYKWQVGDATDYVDYSSFSYSSQAAYAGIEVSFVETQDTLECRYVEQTADIWVRVLGEDSFDGSNIAAIVQRAEDTRKVVNFIHTIIHDPLPEPEPE